MTRTDPQRRRHWQAVVAAASLLGTAVLAGVLAGPAELPVGAVLTALADRLPLLRLDSGLSPLQETVLWELRLPRVILAALVGGMLALAGAAYQGVFRNPLADPYLLGAAAGAGLGATLVIGAFPGGTVAGIGVIPVAAFVGALTGVTLAYLVAAAADPSRGAATLVLAGVAVASFLTAVQTFAQQRQADTLRTVYAWILGRLTTSGWDEVLLILPYAAVSTVVILLSARVLDVLAVGDDEATALGVPVAGVRLAVLAAASLATAAAVAVSGLIGFVGLVVPHMVRRLAGSGHRLLLPLALLGGGAFLVLADLVARTVLAPQEIPIGVVTAFVGAPFFALLLRVTRRDRS